ncbi:NUDIX hydrolase [Candidatus Peregrinibacteria bacterium]|nr:NUDIX hydrolase [Candidatus Peregrinibacteria bacterium]
MTDLFGREGKRPTVACDTVVFTVKDGVLCVLLVVRGGDPFKGMYALPGGFMEWGESCEEGARRELKEETGLEVEALEFVGVFSKPGRDPRGTVVSVEYLAVVEPEKAVIQAGDDAAEAEWVAVEKVPVLAFDHSEVFASAKALFESKDELKKRLGM